MKKLIIVSGTHRSGTSWIGKTLCSTRENYYINEPFNPSNRINNAGYIKDEYWPLSLEEYELILPSINNIINGRYPYINNIKNSNSLKDYLKTNYYYFHFLKSKLNIKKTNYIIKDPFLLFLIEEINQFFSNTFEIHINITFKDPISFVSSCKKKNWDFDFDNLLKQKNIHLKFTDLQIERMSELKKSKYSLVHRLTFLWELCNLQILRIASIKNVHICNHREFSLDPIAKFKKLFKINNIKFCESVESFIIDTCFSKRVSQDTKFSQDIKRNSIDVLNEGRKYLTNSELEYIINEQDQNYKNILKKINFV